MHGHLVLARLGGDERIRTSDTVTRMPHFECGAFNRSATSPLKHFFQKCSGVRLGRISQNTMKEIYHRYLVFSSIYTKMCDLSNKSIIPFGMFWVARPNFLEVFYDISLFAQINGTMLTLTPGWPHVTIGE